MKLGVLIRKLPVSYNKNKSIPIDPNLLPVILWCKFCENCLLWWLLHFTVRALFMHQALLIPKHFYYMAVIINWDAHKLVPK